MVLASYTNGKHTYTVNLITTKEKIPSDSAEALELVNHDIESIEEYVNAMNQSVEQGLAYEIHRGTERLGYVYNRNVDGVYYGASINVKGFEAMAIALKTMFEINKTAHKIVFKPHGNNIMQFKGMIKGQSIRAWHNGKQTVSILRSEVEPIGERVFNYLGLEKIA